MRVRLISKGNEIPAGPFIQRYVGNVCRAISASLKGADSSSRRLEFCLGQGPVQMRVDGISIPLDHTQGFAATIVEDTLRGMIRNLKGVNSLAPLDIVVELQT